MSVERPLSRMNAFVVPADVAEVMSVIDAAFDGEITMSNDDLVLLTLPETSTVLRCSLQHVKRRIADGSLRSVRSGRRVLVSLRDLRTHLYTSR